MIIPKYLMIISFLIPERDLIKTYSIKQARHQNISINFRFIEQLQFFCKNCKMRGSLLMYQSDCRQKCNAVHGSRSRRHGEIEVPRFKTKLQQFLSIDDQHWQGAINLQFKVDELISKLKTIKQQLSLEITDKKLLYALNWDNSDRIIDIFKLAINGQYNKMSCDDLFRVHQKIQKPRTVLIKEIKKISQDISDKLQKQVETTFKNCFSTANRYEKREEVNAREEKTVGRPEKAKENVKNPFDNNLPTVKINQIDAIETHFNVLLKVIKINKHFRIEGMAKIQFQGGDETGKSLVVIDQINILKPGKVFAISNARIYSFHGVKQIQMSRKDSEISQSKIDIDNIGEDYHLSRRRNQNKEQRERPPRRQEREQYKRRDNQRDVEERPAREVRAPREDRPVREERRPRGNNYERIPRQDRPARDYNKARGQDATKSQRVDKPKQYERIQNRQQRMQRQNKPPKGEKPFKRDRVSDQSQDKNESVTNAPSIGRKPRQYQIVKQQEQRGRGKYQQQPRPSREQYSRYERPPQKGKQQTVSKIKSSSSSSSSQLSEKQQQKPYKNEPALQKINSNRKFNKIGSIQPGDEGINLIAQIYKKQIDGPQPERGHFLSIIGDQTGIVRINLPKNNPAVKQGAVIMITLANSEVDLDHRITLKLSDEGLIQKTNIKMTRININKNMSEELWQSEEQDKQQQDQKPIIEDF